MKEVSAVALVRRDRKAGPGPALPTRAGRRRVLRIAVASAYSFSSAVRIPAVVQKFEVFDACGHAVADNDRRSP